LSGCRIAPRAKYGDESVYFDLKDVENTAGSWDMYGVDSTKRYPDRQVGAHPSVAVE
jgi:photosystem I subunit 6